MSLRSALNDSLRAKSIVVECIEVLAHGPTCCFSIPVLVPVFAGDRPTLVGIGLDEARINRKPFATHQLLFNAIRYDPFEEIAQEIALSEALVTSTRKR